jgi:hypothetical protein
VGKSTLTRNLAHQAVLAGHTVLCPSAGHMLNALAGADGDKALRHRLSVYARPRLLLIDEIGYLSSSNRHADLLFESVSRRYQEKSTLVTTNRPFAQWGEVFPNAACVVSLIDRLVHNAEIIQIEGESYRLNEAKERSEQRRAQRAARRAKPALAPLPPRTVPMGPEVIAPRSAIRTCPVDWPCNTEERIKGTELIVPTGIIRCSSRH